MPMDIPSGNYSSTFGCPVQASLGRGFYAGGHTRTVGKIPASSLFRAVQWDSISTGPRSPLK